MFVRSRSNLEHYVWAEVSDGCRILDGGDLSVIEERMPSGAWKLRHVHNRANQFFYTAQGILTIELEGSLIYLLAGGACNLNPVQKHQSRNVSSDLVHFLVILLPTACGNRRLVPVPCK